MMLHITRDSDTGAQVCSRVAFNDPPPSDAYESYESYESTASPRPQHADGPVLVPKLTQPGDLRFVDWCAAYEYFVDCMMNCLRVKLGGISAIEWDWDGMRSHLERYLYRTSANRHRTFVLLK